MTRFLLKLILLALIFIGLYSLMVHRLSTTHVDEHYYKFTQEASSLVLGISRANQGINPDRLEKEFAGLEFGGPVVNFALNKYQSPYGEVYQNAIEQKLSKNTGGLFILSVSPGNFVAPNQLNESEIFDMDSKMSIGKIDNYTSAPNYEYIVNCFSKPLYIALFPKESKNPVFHQNGWQEAKLEGPDLIITPELMNDWKSLNIREYHRILKRESVSEYRISQFKKIIGFLKSKGEVVMVRMPIDCDILEDENEEWPEFELEMQAIADDFEVAFFNYSDRCNRYTYYDGSHLESESANRFTGSLARDIKNQFK